MKLTKENFKFYIKPSTSLLRQILLSDIETLEYLLDAKVEIVDDLFSPNKKLWQDIVPGVGELWLEITLPKQKHLLENWYEKLTKEK